MDTHILTKRTRRRLHVRSQVKNADLPRLSVSRSNIHMYAQIVDNKTGNILAAASDMGHLRDRKNVLTKTARAEKVGLEIAEKAKKVKVTRVVFDRAGYRYHGRVKAVAESARAAGLKF